jgi:phage-related protein
VKFIGEGFIVLSKVTREGAKNVLDALLILVKGIPEIAAEMAKGLLQFLKTFVEGTPDLIKIVVKLIEALLTAVEKVLPKLLKVLGEVLGGIIKLITEKYVPLIVKLGLAIIMSLVQGIRDNIGRLVTLVGEIITRFIDALSVQIPSIVKSISNFMTKVLTAVAEDTGRTSVTLMPSVGMALIQGILDGMAQMIGQLWPWIKEQFGKIIDIIKGIFGINSPSTVMMDIGVDIIMGLFNGIVDTAVKIKDWFLGLAGKVLEWIGDVARWLWDTGVGILESLSNGILEGVKDVKDWFLGLGDLIIGWISDATEWLLDVGKDIMTGLLDGIEFYWDLVGGVKDWIVDLPKKIVNLISKPFEILRDVGEQIMRGLKQGLLDAWHLVTDWVSDRMEELKHLVTHPWEVLSPSKYMIWVGEMIMGGLAIGLEHDSEVEASIQSFGSKMKESIASIVDSIETEYKPVITPVIEMSALEKQIQEDIMYLGNTQYGDAMFALGKQYRDPYDPSMSQAQYASLLADLVNQAKYASLSWEDKMTEMMRGTGFNGVTYQQNIYAPTQLSTSDIYKQTRNQITIAKEELSIP